MRKKRKQMNGRGKGERGERRRNGLFERKDGNRLSRKKWKDVKKFWKRCDDGKLITCKRAKASAVEQKDGET